MTEPALTTPGAVVMGIAGVAALANWWAVSVGRQKLEWVAKPLVMVALVAAALCLDPANTTVRVWVIVGLVCSLAGDVFLMLPRERFVEGLASFLLAHVAYIVGFAYLVTSWPGVAIGLVAAIVALALIGRPIIASVRRDEPAFTAPVIAYMTVISAMVVTACATARGWEIAGALSFFASDGILATNKFVRRIPGGRFAIMSTYHVAQFCFVIALVR